MKQKLSIVTFLFIIGAFLWVCTSSAIPPMPTYDGTGVANITTTNIVATGGNITGLTFMETATAKFTTGAALSKILTSDAVGNATWENAPNGTVPDSGTAANVVLQGDGAHSWSVSSILNGIDIGTNTPASGSFTILSVGDNNAVGANYFRAQNTYNNTLMAGQSNYVNDWYGIALGSTCINDAKNSLVEGNVSFAGGNDSHAEGNRTVTGRRYYVVESYGVDTDADVGEKAFVVVKNDQISTAYGDVTSFFPNTLTDNITTRYGAGAQQDAKGNVYPSGMTPAVWNGNTITTENDLEWAMHPYMVIKGSNEPEISIVKILKATYDAGTGTKIYYDSATSLYTTIDAVYSSYAPTVSPDATGAMGNGQHAEGFKTASTGHGSHSEGLETRAYALGAHSEGKQTLATGIASHAQGNGTVASGNYSFAGGTGSKATAENSVAMGSGSTASGVGSFAFGTNASVSGVGSVVISLDNDMGTTIAQDHSLVIRKGKVGIGDLAPHGAGTPLSVAGDLHIANGYKMGYLGANDTDLTHRGYMLPYDASGNLQIVTAYGTTHILLLPTGGVGIGIATGTALTEKLEVAGNVKIKGTTGGRKIVRREVNSGALSGASKTVAMGIPANARLDSLQMNVRTALTSDSGTTWTAAFSGGSTSPIISGANFAANTVANVMLAGNEITSQGTNITLTTPGGNFTAGNIQLIVYTIELDNMLQ